MLRQISRIPLFYAFLAIFMLFSQQAAARELPEFARLVEENGPAVVNITTTKKMNAQEMIPERFRSPENEELFDELMKRFFGDGEGGGDGEAPFDFDSNARGSGFIMSEDGYVVTNHHVVNGADEVIVKLNDQREFEAELVGSDKRSDLALLKIEAEDLPVVKMGNSDKIAVGEWVLAIGSPFGFESSATSGIISATGRNLPRDSYVPFIQTDVAINPGNSGGPLFNLDGEVIGINSQIYSRSGGFMGLSFAIPINMAMDVIEQLKAGKKVKRGWIGVYIQEVDRDLARSFGMLTPSGALVAQVMAGGPSEGTLQAGDVIIEFNGMPVRNASSLPTMVGMTNAGQKVPLVVMREKKRVKIELTIGELPTEDELADLGAKSDEDQTEAEAGASALGMTFKDLDEQTKNETNLTRGILVEKVSGGAAKRAGIEAGDVISLIDNRQIDSAEQFAKLASDLPKGETVAVLVHRDGNARFMALKVE
ncbi:MAG: DegQ family serine endoprotease [Thiolinea sp.]